MERPNVKGSLMVGFKLEKKKISFFFAIEKLR